MGEPSNRWPWVGLAIGALVVVAAVVFFFFNRSSGVNISLEGTPTPNPVARASTASPGPPPTLVPPTPPTSAPVGAAATLPAPTKPAAPTAALATATPVVIVVTATPATAQPTPSPLTPPSPPAAPTATPFSGQVANTGGVGNQRSDLDAAYGPPVGETVDHLVVYRKNSVEYHVSFVPDLNGRAAVLVGLPAQGAQPLTLALAQSQAHQSLPKDAQPPNPTAEGNDQFVVERYTSQMLAQALPPQVFSVNGGQPGQLMIVYVRDAQGRITRWIIGPGNDPSALINQGR
jgi:hypothetical protein